MTKKGRRKIDAALKAKIALEVLPFVSVYNLGTKILIRQSYGGVVSTQSS
jgi:hypothetical protein